MVGYCTCINWEEVSDVVGSIRHRGPIWRRRFLYVSTTAATTMVELSRLNELIGQAQGSEQSEMDGGIQWTKEGRSPESRDTVLYCTVLYCTVLYGTVLY